MLALSSRGPVAVVQQYLLDVLATEMAEKEIKKALQMYELLTRGVGKPFIVCTVRRKKTKRQKPPQQRQIRAPCARRRVLPSGARVARIGLFGATPLDIKDPQT